MGGVKWIKLTTTMFDDEKINFIESLPEADAFLIVWIKLLTMAGKCNANGLIFLTESIPYSVEMLAHTFRRPLSTVKLALEMLNRLEMIEFDDQHLRIVNWEKHQNVEGMDRIREQNRKRVAKHREKKRLELAESTLEETDSVSNVTCNVTVTDGNAIDKELELEKNNVAKKFGDDHPAFQLAKHLKAEILHQDPATKVPNDLSSWMQEADRMLRLDQRDPKEALSLITWAQHDSFWRSNILSMSKFRKQYDKLRLQKEAAIQREPSNISNLNGTSKRGPRIMLNPEEEINYELD